MDMTRTLRGALFGVSMVTSLALGGQGTLAAALKVDQYTLDNGLQIVVIPDHRSPVVTSMVWYRVGSADDPKGKSGIAHFLEHLMFKGTAKIPPGEFSKLVRRKGGEDNAFTSYDFTAYFQKISKDNLDFVLGLEADRMQNLRLSDENVLPERSVVQEERRLRTDNDPSSLFGEQMSATFYMAHPYRRPIIGWMEDINALTREDALAFYQTYYTPQNAILIVAGDVGGEEVLALAQKHFGPLENTAPRLPRKRTLEPPSLSERRVVMHDGRVTVPSFQRLYHVPSATTAAPGESEALEVLSEILGGSTTSRLYRTLVVERGLASHVDFSYDGDGRDNGALIVSASPTPKGDVQALEAGIDEVLSTFLKEGALEEEVRRAKNRLVAETTYALDSQFHLAYLFGVALTADRKVEDVLSWDQKILGVTTEKVTEVARKFLMKNPATTGLLLPNLSPTP